MSQCERADQQTPKPAKSVLAIGAVMMDVLCRIPNLPSSGEGVVVSSSQSTLGGCAFNSANAVRQLGAPCILFAPVGEGVYAGFIAESLSQRGLEIPLRIPSQDNGLCTCLVDPSGQRTMITAPGVERNFQSSWFEGLDTSQCACALVAGYEIEGEGGVSIIEFCENHPELEIYYAPGPRIQGVGEEKTARINALKPIWHLNDQEALTYTGCGTLDQAAEHLVSACGNAVVVTAGSHGSHVFDIYGNHCFVATDPVEVVDTVGAGDSHLGALAAARVAGYSWEEALSVANRVARAVCSVSGATLGDEEYARLCGISLT